MPANPKYLTQSSWQRFAKLTAGFIGGFGVCIAFHVALAAWFNQPNVVATSSFTSYLLWGGLLILSFLAKNGWKLWGLYILMTLLLLLIYALA